MKKQLFTFCTALGTGLAFCQSVPNGNFESWTSVNYENPANMGTSNFQHINNNVVAPNNAVKTTDAYHGSFALQLNTVLSGSDTAFAFAANGQPGPNPTGGIPYSQQATGISFRYKSNIMLGDTAFVVVQFKKAGSLIGSYFYKIGTTQSSYTLFSAPFVPALPVAPDTVLFGAASSNAFSFNGIPGNMLQLDSVNFTAGSQPANFDGDFESWVSLTNWGLTGWELNGISFGAMQTSDAHSGSFALELKTFADPNSGGNANVGTATTGHQGQSGTMGGYPFTSQNDSLIFWYKYTPANPNDSANIYAETKAAGSPVGGGSSFLAASATYKRAAIYLSSFSTPDSLIISLSSSKSWPVPANYVGADLKIDDMYLLSAPLGIKQDKGEKVFSVFPNPSNGIFNLAIKDSPFMFIEKIIISDMNGNVVDSRFFGAGSMKISESFDISKQSSGVYVIQITTNTGVFLKKINKSN